MGKSVQCWLCIVWLCGWLYGWRFQSFLNIEFHGPCTNKGFNMILYEIDFPTKRFWFSVVSSLFIHCTFSHSPFPPRWVFRCNITRARSMKRQFLENALGKIAANLLLLYFDHFSFEFNTKNVHEWKNVEFIVKLIECDYKFGNKLMDITRKWYQIFKFASENFLLE